MFLCRFLRSKGNAFSGVLHKKIYLMVGMRTPGERIAVNFGSSPFKFDLETFLKVAHIKLTGNTLVPRNEPKQRAKKRDNNLNRMSLQDAPIIRRDK